MKLLPLFLSVGVLLSSTTTFTLASSDNPQIPLLTTDTTAPPLLGFGTWNLRTSGPNTTAAVSHAIQAGYRHIDCAVIYGNQADVGKGIQEGIELAGIEREDLWVTSKLWNDHHGDLQTVEAGLDQTLQELGLDYLDLYLMHWPVGNSASSQQLGFDYLQAWTSMTQLPKYKAHNIGISNFGPDQLSTLLNTTTVIPAVHQMELHPYLQQREWIAFHQSHGIHVTAYSPLGNMNPTYDHHQQQQQQQRSGEEKNSKTPPLMLENEVIGDVAKESGCTPAQVVLAWGMSRGISVIPKSKHVEFIEENLGAVECDLSDALLAKVSDIHETWVVRFNNPSRAWNVRLFEGLEGI